MRVAALDEEFLAVAAGLRDGGQVGEARLGQAGQRPVVEVASGAGAVGGDGVFGDPEGDRAARSPQLEYASQGRRQRLALLDVDRAGGVAAVRAGSVMVSAVASILSARSANWRVRAWLRGRLFAAGGVRCAGGLLRVGLRG